jgi:hypothetical protein
MSAGGPALHTDELHLAPPNTVREHPACSESLSWLLRPAAARGRSLRCCVCAVTSAPPPAPRLLPSAPRACESPEHARRLACGTALGLCLWQRLHGLASLPEERQHAVLTMV